METSLKAIFGMDSAGFRADLKQTMAETRSAINSWAGIVSGVAVGAVIALSKSAIELGGHLSDTSQNLGINVESLQALEAQHKRNGVSQEELTKGLEKTRAAGIKAADGDTKQLEALTALGINAAKFIQLPLDQQYEAIGKALNEATDKNVAYNAVTGIFGEKVGPKMMESLRELGEIGLPKVTAEAIKAGQVLSAETVVALDRAGDAIDDFKKKAVVGMGNIIVNFRTTEGLQLLGLQLLKLVGVFGAKIVDGFHEAGSFVWNVYSSIFIGVANKFRDGLLDAVATAAGWINKILPNKFQINVANIESLKSAGEDIGVIMSRAIATTKPATFAKDVADYWDKVIADQQKVVTALNHVDLGKEAKKLTDAGKDFQKSAVDAAGIAAEKLRIAGLTVGEKLMDGAVAWDDGQKQWSDNIDRFVDSIKQLGAVYGIDRKGKAAEQLDQGQLQALQTNLNRSLFNQRQQDQTVLGVEFGPGGYKSPQQFLLEQELARVKAELALRSNYSRDLGAFGQGFIDKNYGATDVERLKNISGLTTAAEQTNQKIDKLEQTIRDRIPTGAFDNSATLSALDSVSANLRSVGDKIAFGNR
ncbi:MAG: hypothetical protein JWQ89_3495 [Devosia sp.]|uniref:hypothetical protein n=1 Tax=Devosia sp. TaxID=1871048 RepID=UPI0026347C8F|nr:hypothetical protein [Devosia sp.]MDB5541768.1 hypothetical protein [Devosia sp.]